MEKEHVTGYKSFSVVVVAVVYRSVIAAATNLHWRLDIDFGPANIYDHVQMAVRAIERTTNYCSAIYVDLISH